VLEVLEALEALAEAREWQARQQFRDDHGADSFSHGFAQPTKNLSELRRTVATK
jgi:hypothetical protein